MTLNCLNDVIIYLKHCNTTPFCDSDASYILTQYVKHARSFAETPHNLATPIHHGSSTCPLLFGFSGSTYIDILSGRPHLATPVPYMPYKRPLIWRFRFIIYLKRASLFRDSGSSSSSSSSSHIHTYIYMYTYMLPPLMYPRFVLESCGISEILDCLEYLAILEFLETSTISWNL